MSNKVVLTDEQVKEVEELAKYLTTEQIADYFGIGRTTFYEILKRQPLVPEHYKKGKATKIYDMAKHLSDKATKRDTEGDTTALIFFLKTQAGWSEKQIIETNAQPILPTINLIVDDE